MVSKPLAEFEARQSRDIQDSYYSRLHGARVRARVCACVRALIIDKCQLDLLLVLCGEVAQTCLYSWGTCLP